MRHRIAGRQLNRDTQHRLAMRRNMVLSLFEHERISTTKQKAKEIRGFAEKLITLSKKGTLHARRRAIQLLGNRYMMVEENDQMVKKGTVIGKLFSELGPRYLDRPGGYTRIIPLAKRRLGDNGEVVLLQLIGADEKPESKPKKSKKKAAKKKTAPKAEQAPVETADVEAAQEDVSQQEVQDTAPQTEVSAEDSGEEKKE